MSRAYIYQKHCDECVYYFTENEQFQAKIKGKKTERQVHFFIGLFIY